MKPTRQRWTDERLCEGLKQLWRETFGDTEDYISVVFGRVYSQSMTRWRASGAYPTLMEDGDDPQRPVAMLYATPCRFGDDASQRPLTGIYLSGLATDIYYRRHGIMAMLIEEFIAECKNVGVSTPSDRPDFLFLIPADHHLRRYYERFGFRSSGARVVATVTPFSEDMAEGEWRVIDLATLSDEDRVIIHARISEFENRGMTEGCLQIFHSHQAIDIALAESALNSGRVVVNSCSRPSSVDGFLWGEPATHGWVCRTWDAVSPGHLQAMMTALQRDALSRGEGVGEVSIPMKCALYGASWQSGIMEEMHRAGYCSAPVNESYGMVLPLSKRVGSRPLSIGLMLD